MFGLRLDRQSRIIIAAYVIFCVGLLLTSLYVAQQVRLILNTAENLYAHPFTVSNKALEARLTVKALRSEVLFAVLSRDTRQVRQVQEHVVALDATFAEALGQVRSFYLGDTEEVERAEKLFAAWKPVRDNILATARRGNFDQAQALIFSAGTPLYDEIDSELGKIIGFARNRAALFIKEAQDRQGQAKRVLILVMLGGFAASFLCSALAMRHTRRIVSAHEQALERMAHHDALTGLPNRQMFFDRLGQALRLAEREKRQAALLYVDLDQFKAVNDTFGHEAGDKLLTQVSQGFAAAVRRSDTVARLGGDEFAVMLQDVKDQVDLREVAAKILKVAATPCAFRDQQLEVSASVGIAVYPADGADAETLLGHADEAMYRAKKSGRNQFHFYAVEPQA